MSLARHSPWANHFFTANLISHGFCEAKIEEQKATYASVGSVKNMRNFKNVINIYRGTSLEERLQRYTPIGHFGIASGRVA